MHSLIHELILFRSGPLKQLFPPSSLSATLFTRIEKGGLTARWSALIACLNLPWFSRVWIVQEVSLASAIEVRFRPWTYDWDSLVSTLKLLTASPNMLVLLESTQEGHRTVRHIHNHSLNEMRATMSAVASYRIMKPMMRRGAVSRRTGDRKAFRVLKRADTLKSPTPLNYLLEKFAKFESTEPLDKVFALLGLMGDEPPISMVPNYSSSVQHVFSNTVQHILSDPSIRNRPSILALAGTGYVGRRPGLCSWIPDWTKPPPATLLSSCEWDSYPFDYAASDTSTHGEVDTTLGLLHLDCIGVDKISARGKALYTMEDDNFAMTTAGGWVHVKDLLREHNSHTNTLNMVETHVSELYPFKSQ